MATMIELAGADAFAIDDDHREPRRHAAVPHRRLGVGALRHVSGRNVGDPARHRPGGARSGSWRRERITHTFVVPAVLMFLLGTRGSQKADMSSLTPSSTGHRRSPRTCSSRACVVFDCRFSQVYGMTETTGRHRASRRPRTTTPTVRDATCCARPARPFPVSRLRIVDPDTGDDVPADAVGEIWTRSPYNMVGYWEKPEETAGAIVDEGWLRTGDAGYIDDEGYLFLHDRIKDMIVSGGENIYPAEVENVLLGIPGVADAAVIGVPDDDLGRDGEGRRGRAGPGAPDDHGADAIISHCRGRLAHYKCPTSVDFVEALPRNPVGQDLEARATGALLGRSGTPGALGRRRRHAPAQLSLVSSRPRLGRSTVRARMPSVARSAPSDSTGKIPDVLQLGADRRPVVVRGHERAVASGLEPVAVDVADRRSGLTQRSSRRSLRSGSNSAMVTITS